MDAIWVDLAKFVLENIEQYMGAIWVDLAKSLLGNIDDVF